VPTRMTDRDKKSVWTQAADLSRIMVKVKRGSAASYTGWKQVFRILCGSIQTLLAITRGSR
jgi:hypothetical protein